jgi:3-oxoacid CoA-transferase subunit A
MIKHLIFTGDTHGGVAAISRVGNIQRNTPEYKPEETMIVILGDAGLNFWLNNTDKKYKKLLNSIGYHIYCVRGNHEQRPELVKNMILVEDENVDNSVWMEEAFPNIRYFVDGNVYNLCGHSALVIGGAYSVDKWYRLARAGYAPEEAETANPKKCGWFKDECLTIAEMDEISQNVYGKSFDFILSHTCPISWEPTDLFLGCIDQSTVDKSMELWLDELKDNVNWKYYLFGHYHADRIERPYVEQFYQEYEDIETICARWDKYKETDELDWYLPKSPNFYMGV